MMSIEFFGVLLLNFGPCSQTFWQIVRTFLEIIIFEFFILFSFAWRTYVWYEVCISHIALFIKKNLDGIEVINNFKRERECRLKKGFSLSQLVNIRALFLT